MISWSLGVVVASLFLSNASCMSIVVNFDGSLRQPSDYGFPVSTLGWMAACACSITNSNTHDDKNFILGGKSLNTASELSSGEAEYHGLLFALKTLREYCEHIISISDETNISILVQGDCKNVINQMIGKAIPRRLEQYQQMALAEVKALHHDFYVKGKTSTITFQHIPRVMNVICDRISACVIMEEQRKALIGIYHELNTFHTVKNCKNGTKPSIGEIVERWLLPDRSLIPLSKRPNMYRYMIRLTAMNEDYTTLIKIADQYEKDMRILEITIGKLLRRNSDILYSNENMYSEERTNAILCQIFGLKMLGRDKEALRNEQKNRIILQQFSFNRTELDRRSCRTLELPTIDNFISYNNEMAEHFRQNMTSFPDIVIRWYNDTSISSPWSKNLEWVCALSLNSITSS